MGTPHTLDVGIRDLFDLIVSLPKSSENTAGEPGGIVYKIERDKSVGKIAHIRLFLGKLENRENIELKNLQTGKTKQEKITQIKRLSSAAKLYDAGFLPGGDIAEVYGLSQAEAGDIIGAVSRKQTMKTVPLFSVKVTDGNDNPTPLLTAVRELSEEDPLLNYEWEPETRELTVRIMGPIQTETLVYFLKERYGISAVFSPPTVIYKETPLHSGTGYEAYTMPKPCWAVVELSIEPLPLGAGYQFASTVEGEQIPYKYQEHIKTSLLESMKQGVYGWEVTDLKITLSGGGYHYIHTHPLDFFVATSMAFMNGMVNCESRLLEPFNKVRVTADEGLAGKIIGDILAMRGEFDSPVIKDGKVGIEAFLPVSESMDYPIRLASLTSGRGGYFSQFDGYRPCPREFGETTPYRGVNPLDRAKWILHKRSAL